MGKWISRYLPSRRRDKSAELPGRALLRPLSTWFVLLAVIVVTAVAWPLTQWLYTIAGDDPARKIDAVRTGLTIAAGTGGVFALLLAFRRQRATELIAEQNRLASERDHDQRERQLSQNDQDALAQRITEQYARAAEQLGSDKAPVRLAGLFSLEKIGESNTPERQRVVNLVCSYLRMPFTPPSALVHGASVSTEDADRNAEELEVRRTAQNIIARRTGSADYLDPGGLWPGLDIDLSRASLVNFNLLQCSMRNLTAEGANFYSTTNLISVDVSGGARIQQCTFWGPTDINQLSVGSIAVIDGCKFKSSLAIHYSIFKYGLLISRNEYTEAPHVQILAKLFSTAKSAIFELPPDSHVQQLDGSIWSIVTNSEAGHADFLLWVSTFMEALESDSERP